VREHYLSGNQTRRIARLRDAVPEPVAEIHPTLAARFAIEDGAMMRLTSRRGSVDLRAAYSEALRPEMLFASFHWGGAGSVNDLIGGKLDPHSKMPPFKSCAVRIEALHTPDTPM
jgi:assimilatory nitrate reductase catalytic subunit